MHTPNEELHRYRRNGGDPYNSPAASGPASGGLVALLIIVMLLGGLIAYGSLSTPSAVPPAVDTEAPEGITGSGTTEIR